MALLRARFKRATVRVLLRDKAETKSTTARNQNTRPMQMVGGWGTGGAAIHVRAAENERRVSVGARVVENIVVVRHRGEAIRGVNIFERRGAGRSGWRGACARVGGRGGDFGPNRVA